MNFYPSKAISNRDFSDLTAGNKLLIRIPDTVTTRSTARQCCGAGAGGPVIKLPPGAEAVLGITAPNPYYFFIEKTVVGEECENRYIFNFIFLYLSKNKN